MSSMETTPVQAASIQVHSQGSFWQTIVVLFKLRIVVLLLLASMGGAFLGSNGVPAAGSLLLLLVTGVAASAGASALNQVIERDRDLLMRRTKRRPLPAGILRRPRLILAIGIGLIVAAVGVAFPFNPALALFLGLGACIYVGVYTLWLKPRSILNIVIGGAAGSCAVLSGGAAAGTWSDPGVLALAGLLFTWTPMHFWSLALIYSDDYKATGIPMLPVYTAPIVAARWVLAHGAATALIALVMAVRPALGWGYLIPTLVATVWMLGSGARFLYRPEHKEAFAFFKASNLYLAFVLFAICGTSLW